MIADPTIVPFSQPHLGSVVLPARVLLPHRGVVDAMRDHVGSSGAGAQDACVLKACDPDQLVREFLQAAAHGSMPVGDALPPWMLQRFGPKGLATLVQACASYPCAMCAGGVDSCASCGGTGIRQHLVCDACLGLGKSRCSFCGGSGRFPVEDLPLGLRTAIMAERLRQNAVSGRSASLPRTSNRPLDGAAFGRHAFALLLQWNRFLSVIENAVLALKYAAGEGVPGGKIRGFQKRCFDLALEAKGHIARCFAFLAELNGTTGPDSAASLARRLYLKLAQNPALHPDFDHVFLDRRPTA